MNNEDKKKVLLSLEPTIKYYSTHYKIPWLEPDDIAQELRALIWKKLDKFDPTKANPKTFSCFIMKNKLKELFRKQTKIISNNLFYYDIPPILQPSEMIDNKMLAERIIKKIKKLPKKEGLILKMRLGLTDGINYTHKEIANKLRLSRSMVGKICKNRLVKIKNNKEFADFFN